MNKLHFTTKTWMNFKNKQKINTKEYIAQDNVQNQTKLIHTIRSQNSDFFADGRKE